MGEIHVHELMSADGVIDAPTWTFDYGFPDKQAEAINSEIVGAYDPDAIPTLKDEVGDLYTSGSATLVRAMLTRGTRPRLFDEGASPKQFSLAASDRYENGVVYLNYRPQA